MQHHEEEEMMQLRTSLFHSVLIISFHAVLARPDGLPELNALVLTFKCFAQS